MRWRWRRWSRRWWRSRWRRRCRWRRWRRWRRLSVTALLDGPRPDGMRGRHSVSVLRDDDDAQPVANVSLVDDVRRLRGARDLDALLALVAALPGVVVRARMPGPAAVRGGEPRADLGFTRDLRSLQVVRPFERARGGHPCDKQRSCEQGQEDGGGGAAFAHDGGLVLAFLIGEGAGFLHPCNWLLARPPGSSFGKHWSERIFRDPTSPIG